MIKSRGRSCRTRRETHKWCCRLKMAQARARIWPCLSCICQIRSTAVPCPPTPPACTEVYFQASVVRCRCRANIRQSRPDSGLGFQVKVLNTRDLSGRGAARAEDAQGTPTQSHISPSILVYEDLVVPSSLGSGSLRREAPAQLWAILLLLYYSQA